MGRYIDICIMPIPKRKVAQYAKGTRRIGKMLLEHGALASRDYVADDKNATKDSFPKSIKVKKGEVLIYAVAEFKSKAHREQVFKKMFKDPRMADFDTGTPFVDHKRSIVGGFSSLVELQK